MNGRNFGLEMNDTSLRRIDVVMITKNSLKPCLNECITSIINNLPLNRLIVIDSFSTDGTIDAFNIFNNIDIKLIQMECSRGAARELGINNVSTDWFAFIDSDVILEKDWFKLIFSHTSEKIGAVEGNVKSKEGVVQRIRVNGRGYTNCTLIRTSLVKDIKIPSEMVVYEDQYIRRHIERKGYMWLKVASPCSFHLSRSNRLNDAFENGRMSGKYSLDPFWAFPLSFFVVGIKWVFGGGESPLIHYRLLSGYLSGLRERIFERP